MQAAPPLHCCRIWWVMDLRTCSHAMRVTFSVTLGIKADVAHAHMPTMAGLVEDAEHHALVMKYYKRGTVEAFMGTLPFKELGLIERLRMGLQV